MNKLAVLVAVLAAPFLLTATEAGQIADQPAWIAVAHVPKASPLGLSTKDRYDVQRNDSRRGMAVVARGKHYYLLPTELRSELLKP